MLSSIPTATAAECKKWAANVGRVAVYAALADDTRAWKRLCEAERKLLEAAEKKGGE